MKLPLLTFVALSCFFPLAETQDQPIPRSPKADHQNPAVYGSAGQSNSADQR